MRKPHFWVSAALLITVLAFSALFVGCEDEPGLANAGALISQNGFENEEREDGSVPMILDPLQASVSVAGQRVAFRAKGAVLPVIWSPANRAAATINVVGPRSDYAVFQASILVPNTVLAVDAAGRTATANITIGATDGLQLTPNDVTMAPVGGIVVNFVASGGAPPYVLWEEAFPSLGTVNGSGVYTSLAGTGTNIVTVVDSAGDIATATIAQTL